MFDNQLQNPSHDGWLRDINQNKRIFIFLEIRADFPFDRLNLLFIERLILPAYQQSIARALLGKYIPLRLFGKCWEEIEEFAPYAAGPVNSRQHFHEILGGSGALVHVWPTSHVHPVEFTTLPVIRPRHLAVHPDLPEIPAISGEIVRAALQ